MSVDYQNNLFGDLLSIQSDIRFHCTLSFYVCLAVWFMFVNRWPSRLHTSYDFPVFCSSKKLVITKGKKSWTKFFRVNWFYYLFADGKNETKSSGKLCPRLVISYISFREITLEVYMNKNVKGFNVSLTIRNSFHFKWTRDYSIKYKV